jgi:hypothetical protein
MLTLPCPVRAAGESRPRDGGDLVTAAEGERSVEPRTESLRQKDRVPEGVLESSVQRRWIGADGVTLSGLGQGGKR